MPLFLHTRPYILILCLPGAATAIGCTTPAETERAVKANHDDTAEEDAGPEGSNDQDDPVDEPTDDPTDTGTSREDLPEDAAEVVAVDLPSTLTCDDTYVAAVEMRNTGTRTWTRLEGYKLGAVDDTDPLYNLGTRVWLPDDVSVAPGETHVFEFDLHAPLTVGDLLTDWQMVHEGVAWFGEGTAQDVTITCTEITHCDPLTDESVREGFQSKTVDGGSFSASGWQTTGTNDQILLALTSSISASGALEVNVTNFNPDEQYAAAKHQIINMYTSDNGSQAVFETDEAWWNIRTGTNYSTGFKFLSAPNGGDSREEGRFIEDATWDPSDTHTFRVAWEDAEIHIYLDGEHQGTFGYAGRVSPLRHIFLGTDNVYTAQVGPIYSNLCVTSSL